MSALKTTALQRYALLLALLCVFAVSKRFFGPGLGSPFRDGNYYYQIARHVSEGYGLTSSVSLYNQGFKTFPHRVNQSPLWPLTLGFAGRWLGLRASAELLPELFYLVDLVLLYLLANRLWTRLGEPGRGFLFRGRSVPDLGHAAVLVLGTNFVFFRFTSVPYTEGLGFCLLFGALLALDRAALGRSLAWAGFAGLLAGLALLTRAQLVAVCIAFPAALVLAGLRERRFLALAAAAACGAIAPLVPWVLYLSSWIDSLTFPIVLGLATLRETPELAPLPHAIPISSFWEYVLDRAGGLLVAFDPRSANSYVRHFGWATFLVPLGLLAFAVERLRRPLEVHRWLEADRVLVTATLLCGAGALAPVHLSHGTFFREWLFGHRHGLPFLLLLLPALGYLAGRTSRLVRLLAFGLLVAGLVSGGSRIGAMLKAGFKTSLSSYDSQMVEWLDSQSPRPVVVTTRAQMLSVFSRSFFHQIHCGESLQQTLALLRHAGADYVLMYPNNLRCRFIKGREGVLREVRSFGSGDEMVSVLEPAWRVTRDSR